MVNRTYDLKDLLKNPDFTSKIDLIIFGASKELRAQKTIEIISSKIDCNKIIAHYNTKEEKYFLAQYGSVTETSEVKDECFSDMVSNLLDDLTSMEMNNKSILIDSTSLKHPFLFYLLKLLKEDFTPKNLFINYTEPQKYEREKTSTSIEKPFDLTEEFVTLNSLPGFLRQRKLNTGTLLVVTMGFEGSRFSRAFEEISPVNKQTYAVVGFPSFYPNWQYYVYSKNQRLIEASKAHLLLERCSANDPFGIYNILNDIKINNPTLEMTIAPIGTKPHSLGVCMFALDHKDVQLHYDYPLYGSKNRTRGIGKSSIYNLSDFINE